MPEKKVIHTDRAPAAIGPYSQALRVENTVYLSGQIPLDPESMEIVEGGFGQQAVQVFENLSAVCREAGGELSDVVKLNVFLVDLGNFSEVNDIMERYFSAPFPARAAVQVAALPRGVEIEVDAVMVLGD